MAMKEQGMDDLMKYFEGLTTVQKNKVIANSVKQGADIMLQSQKSELTAIRLSGDVVKVTKAKSSKKNGISYEIGMNRGGKDFSDPNSPNFDKYRGCWFQYWGFVTLKKWSKSKRKHPNRKYPSRAKILYHPPDLWLDRAFDKDIDRVTKTIEDALVQAIKNAK